jgi:predicted TIM-barrel fold metal-dependent hydrolase
VQTVFVECEADYREDGPEYLRPVGEAEFVRGVAERAIAAGRPGVAAGFVGFAELRLGREKLDEVLTALSEASGGRLRGIRQSARWQAEDLFAMPSGKNPRHLLLDPAFRDGVRTLAGHSLSYDAWQVHEQLAELIGLAGECDTQIVVNHIGGPIGTGSWASRLDEVEAEWQAAMRELARHANVAVKIGGLGMPYMGYGLEKLPKPVPSETLATAWRPRVEWVIETFGEDRCMFESNFPVDRSSCSYVALWNAFKRITEGCTPEAKRALFAGTAQRIYRLPPIP